MIKFSNLNQKIPYLLFKEKYDEAISAGQKNIEAISISSYNKETSEVDSRYVNIKFVDNDNFIFFSNYNSMKAFSFNTHIQMAALVYWPNINTQIRMKAHIEKTSKDFNRRYFTERTAEKNALAISSNQSEAIDSFDEVKENFNKTFKNDDLKKCPEFWGGFSFTPYYFEFWEGHESRINRREVYREVGGVWVQSFLQP